MDKPIVKLNISGVPKDLYSMSFGRQIEHLRAIEQFKTSAKTIHVSQKRKTSAAAWREFMKLYKPIEFFAKFNDSSQYRDDTYQVWFTTKETDIV